MQYFMSKNIFNLNGGVSSETFTPMNVDEDI